jgi:osmotically inducible protein OsmC
MALKRYATAHWEGDLKAGQGRISTPASGLLDDTRYGFNTRFGDGNTPESRGTNPEELIAAAHAGCFAMALSNELAKAGHAPQAVDARAEVELSMDGAPTISAIRLTVQASVPGIDAVRFRAIADDAKQNCPVSKALSAVPISLQAELA